MYALSEQRVYILESTTVYRDMVLDICQRYALDQAIY